MEQVPRKTYWQMFWRWGYWVPMFWTLALFALVFYSIFDHRSHQMDRDAVRTEATVTAKDIEIHYGRNGEKEPRYRLSYQYKNLHGQTVAQADPVTQSFYDSLVVGQTVAFRYDPANSGHYEIVPGQIAHTAIVNLVIAGFFFACGAWIALVSNLWVSRAIQVRDTGELRSAEIIGIELVVRGWLEHSRALWRDEAGQFGQTWVRPLVYTRTPSPYLPPLGSTITIYADPSGKLRSAWEGDCGAR